MGNQPDLFSAKRSEELKTAGMKLAADNRPTNLDIARRIAREIAIKHGDVTADDVGERLEPLGIELGPAAGSLFKTPDWRWTGEFVKSTRITNHSRLLRVWALK